MGISNSALSLELAAAFPNAKIALSGSDGKYQVHIVDACFEGLNRVKRQQAVYRVVTAHIQSGAIHAINMLLQTPNEHATATDSP